MKHAIKSLLKSIIPQQKRIALRFIYKRFFWDLALYRIICATSLTKATNHIKNPIGGGADNKEAGF